MILKMEYVLRYMNIPKYKYKNNKNHSVILIISIYKLIVLFTKKINLILSTNKIIFYNIFFYSIGHNKIKQIKLISIKIMIFGKKF